MKDNEMDYVKSLADHPLLSAQEEKELGTQIQNGRGRKKNQARHKLIGCNFRLVIKIAYPYYSKFKSLGYDIRLSDLINSGIEGLAFATDKFDPKRGHRFTTYAYAEVHKKVLEAIHCFFDAVHIPFYISQKLSQLCKEESFSPSMSDEEVMKKINVDDRGLKNIRMANRKTFSMDAPIKRYGDEEATLKDLISKDDSLDCEEISQEENLENRDRVALLEKVMDTLPSIQKKILTERFFSPSKPTLSQLAKKFGVTGERIRQIEFKALKTLRNKIKIMEKQEMR